MPLSRKKYIALAAAQFITNVTDLTAVVDTRLVAPGGNDVPLVLSNPERPVTDDDVERFDGLQFMTPVGEHFLTVDDPADQHQGFGVCLFEYNNPP